LRHRAARDPAARAGRQLEVDDRPVDQARDGGVLAPAGGRGLNVRGVAARQEGAVYTCECSLHKKLARVTAGQTTLKCPMHEEPLRLIPPEWRERALTELGINAAGKPHGHIEGDPDPA